MNCKYKHALPPGFILRKKGEKAEAVKEISIEELVEVEVRGMNLAIIRMLLTINLAS